MKSQVNIILLGLFMVFISCGEKNDKSSDIQSSTTEKPEEVQNRRDRYRLEMDEGNFIDLANKKIVLNIPVTQNSMSYVQAKNVSSTKLNAVLIHIAGNGKCTKSAPVIDSIIREISFSEAGIIDESRVLNDPNMLIVIFNSNTLDSTDVDSIKLRVSRSPSYMSAKNKIKRGNPCPQNALEEVEPKEIFQPREQDGDVIGGS